MPNNPIILPRGLASADGTLAAGSQVSVDTTELASVNATNVQEAMSELNRAFALISSAQPGQTTNRFGGVFTPFVNSLTINGDNFELYAGRTALYARSTDARVDFTLPSDAIITAAGVATDEQVEFAILNQAGTGRFDTGFTPTNTVVIDVPGANNIRRNTADGTLLNFIEAHQNDLVTLTQSARGEPWVAVRVTLSPAALVLPSGLFRLHVNIQLNLSASLGFIAGLPSGVIPQAGDAYVVSIGNDTFGGYGVEAGDVLVSLQDNPSRIISATNDDWIVIRNATNDVITLSEIMFLNTVESSSRTVDERMMTRSDVTDVRVFLSTGILDHAPFISPSTDPNNPQDDGVRYVGGDEDIAQGTDFRLIDFTKIGEPAGSTIFPNALMYFDIDGTFNAAQLLNQVFVIVKTGQGEIVDTFNAADDFRTVTLTGSGDTYYVLDLVGATDNYSSISYHDGYTIDVVFRSQIFSYSLTDDVNVLNAIPSRSLGLDKLQANVQALITADHSLTDAQESALNGLQTTGVATVWTAGDLYVRDTNASASSDLSHYVNVGQQNGILGTFDHTRNITFVVPNFVTVTGLQRVDDNTVKVATTRLGAITLQDNTVNPPRTFNGQGFTATLPASTYSLNNPVGDAWMVEGTASNLELTGADDSFKVGINNLEQAVIDRFSPHDVVLPDVLQTLSHDLSVTTRTETNWQTIPVAANQATLTRQFAALWDENRRTFGDDNYFDDLTGVQLTGYQGNNIFYYPDANDPLNTSFPGAQSYILNDNVRFRNRVGQNVISDSFRKIIGFDYALQRALISTDDLSMLRIGGAGTTPIMGLSQQEGLYLNIGRGDGGQRSRTVTRYLPFLGSGSISYGFGTVGGLPTSGEAPFVVPSPNDPLVSFPLTLRVKIRLDNNGIDEGTFEHTYVITNVDASQAETTFTASHTINGNTRTFDWAIRFVANVNHSTFGVTDILYIRDVNPETNAALTDYVSIEYDVTETYTESTTYARRPVNAGSGHDDFGLFDPTRWNTEHVEERNRVLMLFRPVSLTDTSADPEMAIQIIVDGEKEGSGDYVINLNRNASEFDFNDISIGNTTCAVSHIQCYDYDAGHLIGEDGLLDFYNNANRWLGRFRHPTETTDTFVFSGLATFTGVIGGKDVRAEMTEDGSGGFQWTFTEL